MNNGEIVFDNGYINRDHLRVFNSALGQVGIYFCPGKVLVAAKSLRIGIGADEETVKFAPERVEGSRPLIHHHAVARHLADTTTRLEAVAALRRHTALAVDELSPDTDVLCNILKAIASRKNVSVCRIARKFGGSYRAMLEVSNEQDMRNELIDLHSDGKIDISNFEIVRAMFSLYRGCLCGR